MKTKYKIQVFFDAILLVVLLGLMGFHLWGEIYHEWLGVSFFIVTMIHLVFNKHKSKYIFTGERNAFRNVKLVFNISVGIFFMIALISGIMLSRHVVPNIPIHNPSNLVRKIHMTSVYWGVIFASVHLGVHWKLLSNFFMKILNVRNGSFLPKFIMPYVFVLISICGVKNFIQRDISSYLLMKVDFSFFNFDEPKSFFYMGFLSMIVCFSYMTRWLIWMFIFRKKAS